jgi:hypothetical protein
VHPQIQGDGSPKALNKTLTVVYSLSTGMDRGSGMNHLGALLLVEIGGAGVEHHGLDGEVLGVLLPVALLRMPLLHLHLPCNAHTTRKQIIPHEQREPRTPCARRLSPAKLTRRNGDRKGNAKSRSGPLARGVHSLTVSRNNSGGVGGGGVHYGRSMRARVRSFVFVGRPEIQNRWDRSGGGGLRD